jgi:hypothetical protein
MPNNLDDAHKAFAAHFGHGYVGSGDLDERSEALAADLKSLDRPAFLESLPGPSYDADDMSRIALSQKTGGKNPDGSDELVGDSLYGVGCWNNGPSALTLEKKYEAARRVVLDTADLDPAGRAAHRAVALGHAEYVQTHGPISMTDYQRMGAELARGGVPYSRENYNRLIAAGADHVRDASAAYSGSPDEHNPGRNGTPDARRQPEAEGLSGGGSPTTKIETPADDDWLKQIREAAIAGGYY